jgi:hypothetical protein
MTLGSLLDPTHKVEMGDAKLSRAEVAEGVGIFGSGYEAAAMVLAEGARSLGFRALITDSFGKFRPVANISGTSRIYLLGDYVLNPLKPEGRDRGLYVDLICEALAHSFGMGLQTLSDLKGVLLETLDKADDELTLMGLSSLFEAQSEVSSQFSAYGVLQPLLTGGSAAAFRGRQTVNIGEALHDVSVIELSEIHTRSLKPLAQSLLLVKVLHYARENDCKVLLIMDTPEIIWPDTGLQRPDAKTSFFYIQAPQMLREAGVCLCLCSASTLWIERRILSNVGTLIHFGSPSPQAAMAASELMGRKTDVDSFRSLRTSFAYVLRPRSPEPELCRFRRPRWLFTEPSREELVERNAKLGMPPAGGRFHAACKLAGDFNEGAESAFGILEPLRASGGLPFQEYMDRMVPEDRRIVNKLLRLQYLKMMNSEIGGTRQVLMTTTEKGIRALKEYEKGKGGEN